MTLDSAVVPAEPDYSFKIRFLHAFFSGFSRFFFKLYCPLTIKQQKKLPAGSFIFCSNHNSHMDSPILMLASGMSFEKSAMVAARDYFFPTEGKPNIAYYLMNLIPIERQGSRQALSNMLTACKDFVSHDQRHLIVYPEGTRSPTGELQPLRKGPAMISLNLNLPIVPVYIHGSHKALPKGINFPRPTRITAIIGDPIYPQDAKDPTTNLSNNMLYRKITATLTQRLQQLKEQHHDASNSTV